MEYHLDHNAIQKNYKMDSEKKVFTHNTGMIVSLLPYKTKINPQDRKLAGLEGFVNVLGEFSRVVTGGEGDFSLTGESFANELVSKITIDEEHKSVFKGIILEFFTKEEGYKKTDELKVFHPKLFSYIQDSGFKKGKAEKTNLAQFLVAVLVGEKRMEVKEMLEGIYNKPPSNVMEKLVMEGLPELIESKKNALSYKCCVSVVQKLFYDDLSFMVLQPDFFVESFERLLKFYYFFYVSQFMAKANQFGKSEYDVAEPLYFNLDWESTSKTRKSYLQGWKTFEGQLEKMIAQVICLEVLNHHERNEKFSYEELKTVIANLNEAENALLIKDIDKFINEYKSRVDIDEEAWKETKKTLDVWEKISELCDVIHFQFKNSKSRKRVYQDYAKFFEEFCQQNFLKQRGPLGRTLNMTEENLMFLTRLCIKNEKKMRIKTLFREFQKRGVYFDKDSAIRIMQLFDKNNLIEKKSDSGDAQYVKAIL